MIRRLVLGLTILAIATLPLPAWAAWDGGRSGGHETRANHERFGGHERFEHGPAIGFGFYPSPYYAYAPPACAWQPGYSVNQPYVDAWGRYTYVQQWVPGQWICP
jgi:hypothetical protein